MKKLVFESLNEFVRETHPDAYADHVIHALGFNDMDPSDPEYPTYKGIVDLINENRDLLALVDKMKADAGVEWQWDEIDDHYVAGDIWVENPPRDREGVRNHVMDTLSGVSEHFIDMDFEVDPDAYDI